MNFLIQTVDGEVMHDFCFAAIQACKYNNWYKKTDEYKYILTDYVPNFIDKRYIIPIGTVEFVHEYLIRYYNIFPKPINVPEELFAYSNRKIFNTTGAELEGHGELFIKSNEEIKFIITGIYDTNSWALPKGNYQASEIIEIKSEWRAFVYKNKLVGLSNYSGDFTIFTDINRINNMIHDYKNSPIAYTLDVGITDNWDTVIIEVHRFYSCGLYGFSDSSILLQMFSSAFNELIQNKS